MRTFQPELYDSETGPQSRSGCRVPVLHPFGVFHCVWDIVVMLVLVYTCMEVPMTLAFNIELSLSDITGIMSLSFDILLLTDIAVTFRTAYFDKWDRLNLVANPGSIARRYLCGWFVIDLFTSMPFEFMVGTDSNAASDLFDVFRMLRFVRIIKMLRLFKMMKIFDDVVSQIAAREFLLSLKLCFC